MARFFVVAVVAAFHCAGASASEPVWMMRTEGHYERVEVHGIQVKILKEEFCDKSVKAQAVDILKAQLKDAIGLLPECYRDRVKATIIWVDSKLMAAYSKGALAGYMDKTHRLECESLWKGHIIVSATEILWPGPGLADTNRRTFRYWLLHEFAHVIHENVLGFDHGKLASAFRAAVDRKLYDEVWTIYCERTGRSFVRVKERPNTRKDAREYFAELSVAYLAINNAYPYDREDLKKHDPIAFGIMKEVWGDKK